MVKVMASGVFDILHLGHLHFLQEARKHGDELVVVVACDSTVRRMKHEPVTPEKMRMELVGALKGVDQVVLGGEGDPYDTVREIMADKIALGFDQDWDPDEVQSELKDRGLEVEMVRIPKLDSDLNGTRKIIQKVISMWNIHRQISAAEAMPPQIKVPPPQEDEEK